MNDQTRNKDNKVYDLEERTAKFGESIIAFAKKTTKSVITIPLFSQLVRAGTSVGANCCEADDAESKKDFNHKIGLCRKEARESKHWLRMIVKAEPSLKNDASRLWCEAKELKLIFGAIRRAKKQNKQ